jgi:predicted HicB family RNase H-like nuclease
LSAPSTNTSPNAAKTSRSPLTERKFSGKFLVRTSPALHARLIVEAAEQNVSLNQWVVQKLADRPPIGLFDL